MTERPATSPRAFNNNIRCIEMVDIITWDWIKKKFNNNIRCIEILQKHEHIPVYQRLITT